MNPIGCDQCRNNALCFDRASSKTEVLPDHWRGRSQGSPPKIVLSCCVSGASISIVPFHDCDPSFVSSIVWASSRAYKVPYKLQYKNNDKLHNLYCP